METEVRHELRKLPELTQYLGRSHLSSPEEAELCDELKDKGPGGRWWMNKGPTLSMSSSLEPGNVAL